METSVTKHSFEITINFRQRRLKCVSLSECMPINSNSDSFEVFPGCGHAETSQASCAGAVALNPP